MESYDNDVRLMAKKQAQEIWRLLEFSRGALPISNFRSLGYSILFLRFLQSKVGIHFEHSMYDNFSAISSQISEFIDDAAQLGIVPLDRQSFLSEYLINVLSRYDEMDKRFVYEAIRDETVNRWHDVTTLTFDILDQKFAEVEGRSGGEIYSPKDVNELMVGLGLKYNPKTICDPFAGAGNTIFSFSSEMNGNTLLDTQEVNKDAHFQLVIKRIIRNVKGTDYFGDSLFNPSYHKRKYDLIVSIPPLSMKIPKFQRSDISHTLDNPFLYITETLPESRSDWFVALSMLQGLVEDGKLITCMTLSSLTRGGAEAKLRETLISIGIIEQVILLPEKLHFSTSIPTVLVILKSEKKRSLTSKVRFVDASLSYQPGRGKNTLTQEHIEDIIASSQNDGRYSFSASVGEIESRNFNLDPTLYVKKNLMISDVTIKNFRGYKDFSISMHPKLNVLVGENGAGKTSILEAIACGLGPFLTAMPDAKGKQIRKSDVHVNSQGLSDYTSIAIETMSSLSWDIVTRGSTSKALPKIGTNALSRYANQLVEFQSDYPLIVYYGTGRALTPSNSKVSINPFETEVRGEGYDSALDARINYGIIKNWFSKIEVDELRKKDELRDHEFIHPAKRLISETVHVMVKNATALEFNKKTNDVVVHWTNHLGESLQLNLEQLSDGYRNVVALTIDLVRRAYLLNPDSNNPLAVTGIVLIDEIELHLHPRWQQKVLGDLIKLFPCIQFVVTTHSPQVLTTIRSDSIRVVSSGDKTAGYIHATSTYGAESSRMLEEVLGGDSRPQHLDIIKKLNRYTELVESNQWDTNEAAILKRVLEQWGGQTEAELQRLATDIRIREFERRNEKDQ